MKHRWPWLLALVALGCKPSALLTLPTPDGSTEDGATADRSDATEAPDAQVDVPASVDSGTDVVAPIDIPRVDVGMVPDLPTVDVVDVPAVDSPDVPAAVCTPGAATCTSASLRSVCNPDGLATTVTSCPTPAHSMTPRCLGAGVCAFDCTSGFGDCNTAAADGCEADLQNSVANCGTCGNTCTNGVCGTSITAVGGTISTWNLNGAATWDGATNSIVLVPTTAGGSVGTAYYRNAVVVDQFSVTFDLRITLSEVREDGLAFVMQRRGANALGGGGGGLGVSGLEGFAVEFDTYRNFGCGSDSADQEVAISPLTGCEGGGTSRILAQIAGSGLISPSLDNGMWRSASIDYDRGVVTVRLDGRVVINRFTIPGGPVGTAYWLGFGAGTGQGHGREEVRNVVVTFSAPHCL